jgi:hypothetical protein
MKEVNKEERYGESREKVRTKGRRGIILKERACEEWMMTER